MQVGGTREIRASALSQGIEGQQGRRLPHAPAGLASAAVRPMAAYANNGKQTNLTDQWQWFDTTVPAGSIP